ncbi:hypothetical protein T484DRAFT_1916257, partial [Baffinella frigidus]
RVDCYPSIHLLTHSARDVFRRIRRASLRCLRAPPPDISEARPPTVRERLGVTGSAGGSSAEGVVGVRGAGLQGGVDARRGERGHAAAGAAAAVGARGAGRGSAPLLGVQGVEAGAGGAGLLQQDRAALLGARGGRGRGRSGALWL